MIAFIDCFSGISGDMLLGALIDAGAPPEELIKGIPLNVELKIKKIERAGIRASSVKLEFERKGIYSIKDFKKLLSESEIPEALRTKAERIIENLFLAEAKVHGLKPEDVHLHELGSPDTLIDIIGTLRGIEFLGIKKLFCSSVNVGRGVIRTAHGILPVPAPATLELLKGFSIISQGPEAELTTPTGAALLKDLAEPSAIPLMRIIKTGYGAGSRDFKDWPNILRLIIGEPENMNRELLYIIETSIDDMNPQLYDNLLDQLLCSGALDVYIENIIMKKSRPGQKISVLCREEQIPVITDIIFKETTTLGLRIMRVERISLPRKIEEFSSSLGRVRVKIAEFKGIRKFSPEYEDIKAIAKEKGLSLFDVSEKIKKEIANKYSAPLL
ncbi:MAG: nickel pincer cofactor biosynthesis protein LarC [Thermodesulfovibrionales bacterium]|nr:nickel pincer cofactor biosynthesis protein LarC [Thermodesulfovibrionales bacterium]